MTTPLFKKSGVSCVFKTINFYLSRDIPDLPKFLLQQTLPYFSLKSLFLCCGISTEQGFMLVAN